MNVHNIMEDIVKVRVDSLYEQIKKERSSWLTCDCQNCRADATSYVLNRIAPKYVVSGRGATHNSGILDDHQLRADINAICLEGIRLISSSKRPFHELPREECEIREHKSPAFNFPTFVGTILDGSTFEPVAGAEILLKIDGKPMEMVDRTWSNPVSTYLSTNGAYSFWGKSVPAESEGENRTFNFTLEISAKGYSPILYHFEYPIKSEAYARHEFNAAYSVKIKELVLFKKIAADESEEDKEDETNSKKENQ